MTAEKPAICEVCQNTIMLCQTCEEVVKPRTKYSDNPICSECACKYLSLETASCALFLADKSGHYCLGCKDETGLDTEPPYEYGPCRPIADVPTWPRNVNWPPYR